MRPNGPAVWGGCVTRRNSGRPPTCPCSLAEDPIRPEKESMPAPTKRSVDGGMRFCCPGTNFIAYWRDRGTNLIGAANLSTVTKLVACTGAVLSRRSEAESGVAVQTVSEPEICHSAGFKLRADARFAQRSAAKLGVRMQQPLQICLECRSKSKNHDDLSRKAGNNLPILSVL